MKAESCAMSRFVKSPLTHSDAGCRDGNASVGVVQGALDNKQQGSSWRAADRNEVWDPIAATLYGHGAADIRKTLLARFDSFGRGHAWGCAWDVWEMCRVARRAQAWLACSGPNCAPAGIAPASTQAAWWRTLRHLEPPPSVVQPPYIVMVVGVDPDATRLLAGALGLAGAFTNTTALPACPPSAPWLWSALSPPW